MTQTVHTGFSGSPCVVELTPGALEPGSNGIYIDARRHPGGYVDGIEVVHAGHVQARFTERIENAPARIVALMKEYSQ